MYLGISVSPRMKRRIKEKVRKQLISSRKNGGASTPADSYLPGKGSQHPASIDKALNTQVKLTETAGDIDEFTDDEDEGILEEALKAKALPNCCLPCHSEVEQHNITHLPFRDWCPYCVQGKAASYPHRKRKDKKVMLL